jgi:hypothetical protein
MSGLRDGKPVAPADDTERPVDKDAAPVLPAAPDRVLLPCIAAPLASLERPEETVAAIPTPSLAGTA